MQGISRSFHSVWTITKREFNMYFVSPIVYVIGAVWLLIAGIFFGALSLPAMNQGMLEPTLQYMFSPMVFLMMFVAPALTMRLIAEENRTGTHELLQTAPVHDWEIVLGKWLAVWGVFTAYMLLTLLFALLLIIKGNPDIAQMFTGYLGLWLMAGATLAIGVTASSLTQHQAISFMVAMGIILMLWLSQVLTGGASLITQPLISDILSELSLQSHYSNLIQRSLIAPVDIAYFVGVIAVSLFLASQVLSSRRWRA